MCSFGNVGSLEDLLQVARGLEARHVLLAQGADLLLDGCMLLDAVSTVLIDSVASPKGARQPTNCSSSETFFKGILCMPADAVPTAAAVSKIADLIMADGLRSVVGGVWGFDGWGTRDGAGVV